MSDKRFEALLNNTHVLEIVGTIALGNRLNHLANHHDQDMQLEQIAEYCETMPDATSIADAVISHMGFCENSLIERWKLGKILVRVKCVFAIDQFDDVLEWIGIPKAQAYECIELGKLTVSQLRALIKEKGKTYH